MFGRLRPPPSPPDCLERYPAKIIKDDPLSVYESTLLKLKQGSTRQDTTSSETEGEENLSSTSSSHVLSSDTQLGDTHDAMAIDSCESSKQIKSKNPSVLSMFSKYKNQAQARNMKTETQE
ncbi:hypothetical protein AtNW77_Chr3g0203141 [Arabidopsis thaliana]|uniref:At3g48490 n=4 Tax=Arabidopsis TaxID=3701 RepID=Q8LD28_ARATH|nr:uncharacterized protein AT3G48490 [Arabidopsis thaliana]KAG7627769.1 hypothetical protein ISN45_At03g040850 [Arabidopsis thaliana x Arabidopsis arenosa]KAG7633705.1 hypothetical protein ISN44_As03g039870 [Arabidopsis suecica]AAM67313.1 unknown [Arabidopsis thaliana]ABD59091.1 At3g48490 [Arabidopsis thaliana]AEE78422.1 hypothetical protein AT3G48490 [Arabidopsis thaliana]|eukprot:NP_566906.1 hypothetical protein AT3G48490 [Arabidopsis thaliana]